MESLKYLRTRNCACCLKRLDQVPKRDVRRVKECDLVNNLNTVKPIILTNKRKEFDQVEVKLGDLVCGGCMAHAKRLKNNTNTSTYVETVTSNIYPVLPIITEHSSSSTG